MTKYKKIEINKHLQNAQFCKIGKGTKTPIEEWWPKLPYSYEAIKKWTDQGADYGVLSGYNDLVIIDFDKLEKTKENELSINWEKRKENEELFLDTIKEICANTFTVKSGRGGYHFYLYVSGLKKKIILNDPDSKIKTETETHMGEILTYGEQAVGPGSLHPNGKTYKVVNDCEIQKISLEKLLSVVDMYMHVDWENTDKIITPEYKGETNEIDKIPLVNIWGIEGMSQQGNNYVGCHPIHGSEGGSNLHIDPNNNQWHCFRCNSGGGVPQAIAVKEGIIDCKEAVKGALSKEKYKQVIEIAKKKYGLKGDEWNENTKELWVMIGKAIHFYQDEKKVLEKALKWNTLKNETFTTKEIENHVHSVWSKHIKGLEGVSELTEKKNMNKEIHNTVQLREMFAKEEDKKISVYKTAKYLIAKHHIKSIPDGTRSDFYFYEEGMYVLKDVSILRKEIDVIFDVLINKRLTDEIIWKIKDQSSISRKDIESTDLNLICVNNGILNIRTLKLIPHSPDFFFFRKIPIDYDSTAECPVIMKFIKEVAATKDIPVIQEWFGFPLYRKYFIKKALIIYGEPNTGKTTLVNLLKNFIGYDNIAGISLQALGKDKFRMISLYNKLLNVNDDLSDEDIKSTSQFKMATGNSDLVGEKKFGDEFQFRNYAKMVFTANKIPSSENVDDDGYYSRWIPIEFQNQFGGNKKDTDLEEKISTTEELSGLLNWALNGLERLWKNENFSSSLSTGEVRTLMMKAGSIVAKFADEELREKVGSKISKQNMYDIFLDYSEKEGVSAISMKKFGKELQKYATYIRNSRNIINGERPHTWLNVRTKELPLENDKFEIIDEDAN